MSKLEVDKIDPQSGTDLELGSSGDTVTIPTGVTLDASNATTTLPANVVTTTGTQTLTNKTIAAGSNTVTGLTNSNLSGSAGITNANLANSSITINDTAVSLGGSTSISTGGMYKNIIINGDMSIAQRATSESGITGGAYKTIDRWLLSLGSLGTWTQSQSTDVPSGQGFAKSLKMDCTTAKASPDSGNLLLMQTRFEGQNLQYLKKGTANAESLTLSFWVKSNKTGTYVCEIDDADNSRNINKSYTINSANTWEKKEITFAGDTTGAFTNDNNLSMNVIWWLAAGSDFTSGTLQTSWGSTVNTNRAVGQVNLADSTSNEWYITGVQLEAGTSASDFEFLPHDINLIRCSRYFSKLFSRSINRQGVVTSFFTSTRAFFRLPFLVEMRADPTVGTSNVVVTYAQNNATAQTSTFANTFPNKTSMSVEITGTYNTTYSGHVDNSSGTMTVDAEL